MSSFFDVQEASRRRISFLFTGSLVITGLTAEAKALVLFGIFMGCNFPLHVGLTCMFGAWLMCLALDVSNKDLQNELETSSMETVE